MHRNKARQRARLVALAQAQRNAEIREARALTPGTDVYATRFINVGEKGDPVILAAPDDIGTVVGPSQLGPEFVEVRFGSARVVCTVREIRRLQPGDE